MVGERSSARRMTGRIGDLDGFVIDGLVVERNHILRVLRTLCGFAVVKDGVDRERRVLARDSEDERSVGNVAVGCDHEMNRKTFGVKICYVISVTCIDAFHSRRGRIDHVGTRRSAGRAHALQRFARSGVGKAYVLGFEDVSTRPLRIYRNVARDLGREVIRRFAFRIGVPTAEHKSGRLMSLFGYVGSRRIGGTRYRIAYGNGLFFRHRFSAVIVTERNGMSRGTVGNPHSVKRQAASNRSIEVVRCFAVRACAPTGEDIAVPCIGFDRPIGFAADGGSGLIRASGVIRHIRDAERLRPARIQRYVPCDRSKREVEQFVRFGIPTGKAPLGSRRSCGSRRMLVDRYALRRNGISALVTEIECHDKLLFAYFDHEIGARAVENDGDELLAFRSHIGRCNGNAFVRKQYVLCRIVFICNAEHPSAQVQLLVESVIQLIRLSLDFKRLDSGKFYFLSAVVASAVSVPVDVAYTSKTHSASTERKNESADNHDKQQFH